MGGQLSILVVDGRNGSKILSLSPTRGAPSSSPTASAAGYRTDNADNQGLSQATVSSSIAGTPPSNLHDTRAPALPDRYVSIPLPEDVSRGILRCMDLPAKVKLSVCSKEVGKVIFGQKHLWETIDFGTELAIRQKILVSDRSLHRLLEQVQAKDTTKILSLEGCKEIKGFGLEPLRGSTLIEELDLRVKGKDDTTPANFDPSNGLHDSFVTALLPSMMPFARPTLSACQGSRTSLSGELHYLRFNHHRQLLSRAGRPMRIHDGFNYNSQLQKCLKEFDESLKNKLCAQRSQCSHCDGVLVERIPSETFEETDAASTRCRECKKLTCGQDQCPPTSRCQWCFDDKCSTCDQFQHCSNCERDLCVVCSGGGVDKCEGPCNLTFCRSRCSYTTDKCSSCKKTYCEDCMEIYRCEMCDDDFCYPSCNSEDINGGAQVQFCDCGLIFCSRCVPDPLTCSRCHMRQCGDCFLELEKCDGPCGDLICCEPLSDPCAGCGGQFCTKCREISPCCGKCEQRYCSECHPLFEHCSVCLACSSCCKDLSHCDQCNDFFGKKCREVAECRDCGISYCIVCSSSSDAGGSLIPCSSCNEFLCPSCRPQGSKGAKGNSDDGDALLETPGSLLLCTTCSIYDQDTGGKQVRCERRNRKTKADHLHDRLCQLKVERARVRRRLEAVQENVKKTELELLIKDPGWFPCDGGGEEDDENIVGNIDVAT